MDNQAMLGLGAALGAGYLGLKYLDEKLQFSADLDLLRSLATMKKETNEHYKNGTNVTDLWYKTLAKNPSKVCFYYNDSAVTFQEVENRSNQFANFFLSKGLKKGDVAALFMENRPEFVISWLGMTKMGVEAALINTSIKQKGLTHCVKISDCKMLLFGSELKESMSEVKQELDNAGIFIYCEGNEEVVDFAQSVNPEVDRQPITKVDPTLRAGVGFSSTFGYIYTSGTTGLPKAAVILHAKMANFGNLMKFAFKVRETDIVYTCLPLFHSAGGGLGIGMMLMTGCSVVIKKKFSARDFWTDCIKYNVTVTQYIGELCRYLILQPKRPEEKQHHVRIAIGNGLRPEIWDEFQERFNIPEIGEFYGSTEGNGALVNFCTTKDARGKCGKMGAIVYKISGFKIVKFDVVEELPKRDPVTGFCIECDYNEPGEMLFQIKSNDPTTQFAGYKDKKATEKKILRDVFVKGDAYFTTGDLLSRDEKGYFRFIDRIGDTFRWKGENCSTTEVTEVIAAFPGVEEINVYGVQIPNNMDGRAPTAAITPVDGDLKKLDLSKLSAHARQNLPSYAVPLFLRITPQMEVTATMKHQKVKLRTEGIDIAQIEDPLYWLNPDTKQYEPFGVEEYKIVTELRAKL